MKATVDPKWFAVVISALVQSQAKTATKYLSDKLVVRATWRTPPSGRHTREEVVVTFGVPNYRERDFVAACKKAGDPLPVRKVQLRAYPIKKKK